MQDYQRAVPRVLLLTSHPIAGHDGADKDLALLLANRLDRFAPLWFDRKWTGKPQVTSEGVGVPILSARGRPGIFEKVQSAAWSVALAPQVDLTHAIYSIGRLSPVHARVRRRLSRVLTSPVIHTVPGVVVPSALARLGPIGTTVALTTYTADLLKSSGISDVRVIPPGIDTTRWPPKPRPEGYSRNLLFAGHYGPSTGAREAIAVAAAVRSAGRRVTLTLAMRGHGEHSDKREIAMLLAFARKVGIPDITIRGRVPDMPTLMASATVLLHLPQVHTGAADVPFVVLQAMASRRPVVVSELPWLKGLDDAVVRTAPGDVEAARDAVIRLIDDHIWWEETTDCAYRTVVERYPADAMVRQYEDLYLAVLEHHA